MPRNLTPTMLAALQSQSWAPAVFVEADLAGGTVRIWSGIGTISWNGYTWQGVGQLLKIAFPQETGDVQADNFSIALSGIPLANGELTVVDIMPATAISLLPDGFAANGEPLGVNPYSFGWKDWLIFPTSTRVEPDVSQVSGIQTFDAGRILSGAFPPDQSIQANLLCSSGFPGVVLIVRATPQGFYFLRLRSQVAGSSAELGIAIPTTSYLRTVTLPCTFSASGSVICRDVTGIAVPDGATLIGPDGNHYDVSVSSAGGGQTNVSFTGTGYVVGVSYTFEVYSTSSFQTLEETILASVDPLSPALEGSAAYEQWKLIVAGNSLTVMRNPTPSTPAWTTVMTATDSTFASGAPGFAFEDVGTGDADWLDALTASGNPDLTSLALDAIRQGNAVKIWLGALADDGTILADPTLAAAGRVDVPTLEDSAEASTITVSCESLMVDFKTPRTRHYTQEDQQLENPGDNGFIFVGPIQDWNRRWGWLLVALLPALTAFSVYLRSAIC